MKTHKIGLESFHVFDTKKDGGRWMVQFIWGKKDFRVHLDQPRGSAKSAKAAAMLKGADGSELAVSSLQYLINFDWYEFAGVAGHGLAHDEVCWSKGKTKLYLELPKDFHDIAVDIACREFGLERQEG